MNLNTIIEKFEINGESYYAITNSKGVATITATLPNGKYSVKVIFKGDDTLGKKTEYATITINSTNTEDLPAPKKFPLTSNDATIVDESTIIALNEVNETHNINENTTVAKNINLNSTGYIIALISVIAMAILAAIFIKKYKDSGTKPN